MRQQAIQLSREDIALSAAAAARLGGRAASRIRSGITGRYHLIKHYSCADLNGSCILCSSQALRCVQSTDMVLTEARSRHHNGIIRRAGYCNPTVKQSRMGAFETGCTRESNRMVVHSKSRSGVSYLWSERGHRETKLRESIYPAFLTEGRESQEFIVINGSARHANTAPKFESLQHGVEKQSEQISAWAV